MPPPDQPGGIVGRRQRELPLRPIDGVDIDEDVGIATRQQRARRRRRHLAGHAQAGDRQAERRQLLLVEHDEAEVADIAPGVVAQVGDDHFVRNIVAAAAFGRSGSAGLRRDPRRLRPRHRRRFRSRRLHPRRCFVRAALAAVAVLAAFAVAFAVAAGIGEATEQRPIRQADRQRPTISTAAPASAIVLRILAVMVEIAWAIILRSRRPVYDAGFGGMLRTDHSPAIRSAGESAAHDLVASVAPLATEFKAIAADVGRDRSDDGDGALPSAARHPHRRPECRGCCLRGPDTKPPRIGPTPLHRARPRARMPPLGAACQWPAPKPIASAARDAASAMIVERLEPALAGAQRHHVAFDRTRPSAPTVASRRAGTGSCSGWSKAVFTAAALRRSTATMVRASGSSPDDLFDRRHLRRLELVVDIGHQHAFHPWFRLLGHRRHPFACEAVAIDSPSSARPTARRARASRLITVPSGISRTSAAAL